MNHDQHGTDARTDVRVFRNGTVFTADAAGSLASAVAVEDGRVVAVGGDVEIAPYRKRAAEVVDLDGRMLLPGFTDAHAHPPSGGLERIRCDLTAATTLDEVTETIGAYAAAHPDAEWILGGGWSMSTFPGGTPTRDLLDRLAPGRPVALPNRDHHSTWASTRALEIAGVTADTPDPADGRIERDADGVPTGLLHEGAARLLDPYLPATSEAEWDAALDAAQRYLHSVGVVGWQDAMVDVGGDAPAGHEAYLRADAAGRLTARVRGALWWPRETTLDAIAEQVERFAKIRAATSAASDRYRTDAVKVMQDGVAETFTAALLDPYLDRCGCPGSNHGISFFAPEVLRASVSALDAAGFQVHFHALGDRAVRDVLDAVEHARTTNGASDRRHHLAHLQVVHPDDLPRFRTLGATANLQALWAAHEPQMDELTIPYLGSERAGWQYPFGDLLRAGAPLAMGSDWPVSSADPIEAIHVAVNRVAPQAPPGTPALGDQQDLPLAVALRAYTAGSAHVNGLGDRVGTIRTGAYADLVVLDRDPFANDPDRIAEARVHRTYVDGREVHRVD
ncbi:hypothetical protein CLV56_1309 [Mumia flava]|uniref:Amidohydrolase 3 domain-containing protein n=1 Tax=Mumia flava TaxID=1348852 RepID=A0A0B2BP54_9ACTN|nr:amidohydrolase [Mumia flava]PJJ57088.1 hypothetical protein CLV56_1309 [Mumia flava]